MKNTIATLINSRKLFFKSMVLILVLAALSMVLFGKTFASISLDDYHPFWLNVFFINYTFIGNGLFIICLVLVLMFRFKRKALAIAIFYSFLLSGIMIQLLRNINNLAQPDIFMEEGQNLFLIDNISTANQTGFISGHTAIAFALATVLVLLIKNSKLQLPLLLAAMLLGYSRIYLAQHFLPDILIGAVTGIVSGIAAVYLASYFKGLGYYFKKFFTISKIASPTEGNIQPV